MLLALAHQFPQIAHCVGVAGWKWRIATTFALLVHEMSSEVDVGKLKELQEMTYILRIHSSAAAHRPDFLASCCDSR